MDVRRETDTIYLPMHRRKQEEYEEENPHRTMPGETWLNSTVSREHLMGHTDSTNPAAHKAKGYQDREDHGLANDQKHRDISPPEVEGSTTDDAKNIYHSTSSSGSSLSSLQMLLREEDYNPAKEPGKGNTEDIDSKDKHRTHRQSHKKWRRVLYEKQDYPDDYLDDTFLASLVTNGKQAMNIKEILRSSWNADLDLIRLSILQPMCDTTVCGL